MKLLILTAALAIFVFNPAYAQHEGHDYSHKHTDGSVHHDEDHEENGEAAEKYCLVCGPEEKMESLSFSYKHEGKKYHFCSLDCMKVFKKNPEQYMPKVEANTEAKMNL